MKITMYPFRWFLLMMSIMLLFVGIADAIETKEFTRLAMASTIFLIILIVCIKNNKKDTEWFNEHNRGGM